MTNTLFETAGAIVDKAHKEMLRIQGEALKKYIYIPSADLYILFQKSFDQMEKELKAVGTTYQEYLTESGDRNQQKLSDYYRKHGTYDGMPDIYAD